MLITGSFVGDKHQPDLICAHHVWPKGSLLACVSYCGVCVWGNKEGKYSFKLSEEPLEGKGCLKKPTGVYGIAGSTTEMSWWLVLAQVLSPLGFSHPFGMVTAMWRVPCSSPIFCISLGPQGRNESLCFGAVLAKIRISKPLAYWVALHQGPRCRVRESY